MLKTRRSALVSLVLVFLSGSLIGALSYRLYSVTTVAEPGFRPGNSPPREDPEVVRKRLISDMQQRLSLDEKQVVQLNGIYDETRRKFDELHKKANSETRGLWDDQTDRIRAILRPDQLAKYEELRKQRDEERKKRRRDQKGPPPPLPPGNK